MKHRHRQPDKIAAVEPAALWRRLAALVYDWILLTAILFVATVALLTFRGGEAFPAHDPVYSGCLIVTAMAFFGWFWTHGGQTLGMRAWKIQVIGADGQPLNGRQALIRSVVAMLSTAVLGLGFLWVLVDPRHRCWQDIASCSQVIFIGKADTKTGHDSKPSCPA